MNLSIHLPDPLIDALDAYAARQAKSRSSVVREAVSAYLSQQTASAWPADLAQWMHDDANAASAAGDWPDFEAIRAEANRNMAQRSAAA